MNRLLTLDERISLKSKMIIKILSGISLAILFTSCSSEISKGTGTTIASSDNISAQDSVLEISKEHSLEKSFLHNRFYDSCDYLLKSIAGDLTFSEFSVDTVFEFKDGYLSFVPSEKTTIINYHVTPPKKEDFFFKITLRRAFSKDTNEINLIFKDLKQRAADTYEPDMKYVYSPGLTKMNDYVLKSSYQILWVNFACAYSEKKAGIIKRFIRYAISYKDVTDSITCKCGAAKCEN